MLVFNTHIFCVLSYVNPFASSQHVEPTHAMVGIDHGSDDEDDDEGAGAGGAVDLLKFQLYSS